MGAASDTRTLVLHGLRLKGVAEPGAIAELYALDRAHVDSELAELTAASLVVRRDGAISGFQLTPAGRAEHAKQLADELDAAGARPVVAGAYERFLVLNGDLLAVCSRWQLRDGPDGTPRVNDHLDPGHDAEAIADLDRLHHQATPILHDLAAALDRYGRYEVALAGALERVRAGAHDYFTKPMIPSYHTVWFELHEDLLATLGIERASEAT